MAEHYSSKLKGLNFFLGAMITVFAFNAWFLHLNFVTVGKQVDNVLVNDKIISDLTLVLSSVKDVETSFRGYLISKDIYHMSTFESGKTSAKFHLQELKHIFKLYSYPMAQLDILEDLTHQRLLLFEEKLQSVRKSGLTIPPNDPFHMEGRLAMESLRKHVDAMKAEQQARLSVNSQAAERSRLYFTLSLALTSIISTVVVIMGFTMIRKNIITSLNETKRRAHESWLKNNVAIFSQKVAGDISVSHAAEQVLSYLAELAPLLVGKFYILDEDKLKLAGSYGIDNAKNQILYPGQGIVGEAFKQKSLKIVKEIPKDHLQVSSTLGQSEPKSLVLIPVIFQNQSIGIIEMASFQDLSDEVIELFNSISDPIGVGINAAVSRGRLQILLEKTQQQSEELQAQQEELKTNNEELEQQARILENQQQTMAAKNSELEQTRKDVEAKASELEKANQYKSEFLAKMSHELRTPLNSLLILSTLLSENKEKNLSPQQQEFARSIYGAGHDLLNLINDILDLSKIEARKLSLRPEPMSLHSLGNHLVRTFEPQAQAKGLDFKLDMSEIPNSYQVFTDRQRLEQILRNFLSNAMKFTESGEIIIRMSLTESDTIKIDVRDTGIGIPPEKRDSIFAAFEQADSSISRKYGGTGLGLTISRELAHLLGGKITLNSEEGVGSEFSVEIPRAWPHEQEVEAKKEPRSRSLEKKFINLSENIATKEHQQTVQKIIDSAEGKNNTILIVEDDPVFRKSVAQTAQSYGFDPIEVDRGDIALEVLNHMTPKAILLDIKLPGISGMSLLEIIKQKPQLRHVPIHMISALEYQHNALRMGAMGFLGKPVTIDKVRSALTRIENLLKRPFKRLLIVEDDDRQRDSIKQLVAGSDIEILTCRTAKEALDSITQHALDCIILDLSLPDMSGFDLLEKLSEMEVSLPPIVIYTGKDITREEEEYLRKFSESIIIKGAKSPERLLDEVNLFLHRVESFLPEDKQQMLSHLRSQEKFFENRNVLIVDDDLRNTFALTSALESRGLGVRIARNGVEAIEYLEKHNDIDAVLMDIMMPKMDGYEATKKIRQMKSYKDVPIIALTAKAMKEDHEKCIAAGANDYLPKPINLTSLMSVLKVWLAPNEFFDA